MEFLGHISRIDDVAASYPISTFLMRSSRVSVGPTDLVLPVVSFAAVSTKVSKNHGHFSDIFLPYKYSARIIFLSILPVGLIGISSIKRISLGRLKSASLSTVNAWISSAVTV